jgi:hypothetical protein
MYRDNCCSVSTSASITIKVLNLSFSFWFYYLYIHILSQKTLILLISNLSFFLAFVFKYETKENKYSLKKPSIVTDRRALNSKRG